MSLRDEVDALDTHQQATTFDNWKDLFWQSVREKLKGERCSAANLVARLSHHALHPDGLAAHQAFVDEAVAFRAWYRVQAVETLETLQSPPCTNDNDAEAIWIASRHAFDKLSPDERYGFLQRDAELQAIQSACEAEARSMAEAAVADDGTQLQIMLAGPPGSFKSSVGRGLVHLWNNASENNSQAAAYLDQDMCNGKAGNYHACAKNLTTPLSLSKKNKGKPSKQPPLPEMVVFAKSHGEIKLRDNLRKAIVRQRLVYVVMYHSDDNCAEVGKYGWGTHIRDACIDNVKRRGTHHLTLSEATPDMPGIIAQHVDSHQPLEERELLLAKQTLYLDIKAPTTPEQHLATVMHQLQHLIPAHIFVYAQSQDNLAAAATASREDESKLAIDFGEMNKWLAGEVRQSRTRYWCIQLDDDSVRRLTDAWSTSASFRGKIFLKSNPPPLLHVTLYFPCKDTQQAPETYEHKAAVCDALVGQSIQMTCSRIVSDAHAVAAQVHLHIDVPFMGTHPHVTLWTAAGVKPVYSGQLCAKAAAAASSSSSPSASSGLSCSASAASASPTRDDGDLEFVDLGQLCLTGIVARVA